MKNLVYALFILFLLHMVYFGVVGYFDDPQPADALLVYGNSVLSDGAPTRALQERLDTAIVAYGDDLAPRIIVSSGFSPYGFNEAQIMRDYLVEHDIPSGVIVVDDSGVNTRATSVFAFDYIQNHDDTETVLPISHFYHLPRIRMTLKQEDVEFSGDMKSGFSFSLDTFVALGREVPAFYAYLFGAK